MPTDHPLTVCPKCECRDLFIRKDFPQKIGMTLVILAAAAFLVLASRPHTFYLGLWILVGAVLVDVVLYFVVPKITVCYRCRAEFRKIPLNPEHRGFELAIAEKYRQR